MNEQIKPVFMCSDPQCQHLYLRVLDEFKPLPLHRLICYFDNQSVCCEPSERGQFILLENKNNRVCWSDDVRKVLRDESGRLFDVLIYLPGTTCCSGDPLLFVMAFAHELRHFVQWSSSPEIFEASKKLALPVGTKMWDLPHERDETIASKRVAEAVIGAGSVAEYVQEQIRKGDALDYWTRFQNTSLSKHYDWIKEAEGLLTQNDCQAS